MHRFIMVFGFVLVFAVLPAAAEFYKYVDPDGTVHYTDDYNQIPEAQRNRADAYSEYRDAPEEAPARTDDQRTPAGSVPPPAATSGGPEEDFDTEKKRLENRRAELMQAYEMLMKEKEALETERKESKTHAETSAYNKRADAFNEKIKAYEQKLEALNRDFAAYNAEMQKRNAAVEKPEEAPAATRR